MRISGPARFSIASLMLLVLACAAAAALFFKLLKLFENSGTYAIDGPVLVLLCIGLNAIALATARRQNGYQFLTQIGIACGLLLANIHLFESKTRIVPYAIPINLFALLVAPIVLRRLGRTKRKSTPARRFAKSAYRACALAVFNLLILVAEFKVQLIIIENFGS